MLRTSEEWARLASVARQGEDRRSRRWLARWASKEKMTAKQPPLSCAPPLPSQKLLACEGGGADAGGDERAG